MGIEIPNSSFKVPEDFICKIKTEFLRLKESGFKEEFDPAFLFRNGNRNFDELLNLNSDIEEEYVEYRGIYKRLKIGQSPNASFENRYSEQNSEGSSIEHDHTSNKH